MLIRRYKVIISPDVKDELQTIYSYIEVNYKNRNSAKKVIQKLLKSMSSLSYFPEKYVKFQYFKKKGNYRKMPVDSFLIIYEIDTILR